MIFTNNEIKVWEEIMQSFKHKKDSTAEIKTLAPLRDHGLITQNDFLRYLEFLVQYNRKELVHLSLFSKEDLINYIYAFSEEDETLKLVSYFKDLGYNLDNSTDVELLFEEILHHFKDPYTIIDELISKNKIKRK